MIGPWTTSRWSGARTSTSCWGRPRLEEALVRRERARRGDRTAALYSRSSGAVVVLAFIGGAALSVVPAGVALLWLAVVAGWAWLLVVSVRAYRTVPHPDCAAA